MKPQVFIVFNLVLTLVFLQSFHVFEKHFSGLDEMERKNKILQVHLEHKELQHELAEYKLSELKNDVALVLNKVEKKQFKGEKGYPLRRLASVTQTSLKPKVLVDLAKRHFLKGKSYFKKRIYNQANAEFLKVVRDYSYSAHVAEAYFLIVEGYFQTQKYEDAIRFTDELVSLYPESELTGYALLRMGKIFELQDRHEEASGLYKSIMQSFKDHDLIQQARISFRSIKI